MCSGYLKIMLPTNYLLKIIHTYIYIYKQDFALKISQSWMSHRTQQKSIKN